MSVLITMRVKVHDFEGTKKAAQMFVKSAKKAGCRWAKVYRPEKDPNDVLWFTPALAP
jgi:quinol monooxygenase YgiN